MPGLILSPPAATKIGGAAGISAIRPRPRVLAVTADTRFYAGVLFAAASVHCRTEWARSLNRAIEICRLKSPPIVIYDGKLPGVEWERAFDRLGTVANRPRILLAAPYIDEDLWWNVLQRHGYDVIERSASSTDLQRLFRFACLSLVAPADVKTTR